MWILMTTIVCTDPCVHVASCQNPHPDRIAAGSAGSAGSAPAMKVRMNTGVTFALLSACRFSHPKIQVWKSRSRLRLSVRAMLSSANQTLQTFRGVLSSAVTGTGWMCRT